MKQEASWVKTPKAETGLKERNNVQVMRSVQTLPSLSSNEHTFAMMMMMMMVITKETISSYTYNTFYNILYCATGLSSQ